MAARVTADPNESVAQDPAAKVRPEVALDPGAPAQRMRRGRRLGGLHLRRTGLLLLLLPHVPPLDDVPPAFGRAVISTENICV